MADSVATTRTAPAKEHPQSIAEDILDKLQEMYPKLHYAKGETIDGVWRFEIGTRGGFKSECSFPAGTNKSKVYGSFLGWCDVYKIKLGMKFKKAADDEEAA
jgi:hypothetical protein